jgi:hypothetical protein
VKQREKINEVIELTRIARLGIIKVDDCLQFVGRRKTTAVAVIDAARIFSVSA